MANDLNIFIERGRVVSDPFLRYTPAGMPVTEFVVANLPSHYDKAERDWVQGEETMLNCVMVHDLAVAARNNVTNGDYVLAKGFLRTRTVSGPQGEDYQSVYVDVHSLGLSLV